MQAARTSLGFYPRDSDATGRQGTSLRPFEVVVSPQARTLTQWTSDLRSTLGYSQLRRQGLELPVVHWISACVHSSDIFLADLLAGTTVAVMAVPQAVSFAAMAGLPAAFGLYTAFIPVLTYFLFGSSRHLALGPVALVSLLLGDGLAKVIPGSEVNENPNRPQDPALQDAYNRAAIQVSFLVAILYLLMGICRLGFVLDLLSKPIISAFLSAGALLISTSQIKYLVGYSVPQDSRFQVMIYNLIAGRHHFRWPELAFGSMWILILVSLRNAPRLHRKLVWLAPLGPMTVTVLSITLVWAFDLESSLHLSVTGRIEPGLPPITVGWWWQWGSNWSQLLTTSLLIGSVSVLEAISISKALGERHGDKISANHEFIALGVSNLAGAVFCAYPATGSFARSALQSASGAKTGLAGLINAALIGAVLFCLTPVAQYLPLNALAAIVITGVLTVMDFGHLFHLAKVSRRDSAVWLITFIGCLTISIDLGLAMGVLLSLLILFCHTAFPEISIQAQLESSAEYRPATMYRLQADHVNDGLCILRIQGPICFANVIQTEERLLEIQDEMDNRGTIILDGGPIGFVDSPGLKLLAHLLCTGHAHVGFALANPSQRVLQALHRGQYLEKLGTSKLFATVHDAVTHWHTEGKPAYGTAISPQQNGNFHTQELPCSDLLLTSPLLEEDDKEPV